MAQKAGLTTCTLIFDGKDVDVGWSESFQSSIGDLVAAADALVAVANKRVLFLSGRYSITYVRVSLVQAPKVAPARNQRVSYLRKISIGGSLDPAADGDLPFVAALARLYTADKRIFALREFRGIPDSFWSDNDDKVAAAKIKAPLNNFVASLAANNMGINHKVAGGGVALAIPSTAEFERLTHRITGRPFYLSRGRRTR